MLMICQHGNTKNCKEQPKPDEVGQLVWRYIPAVGKPGKADAEYAVLLPKPSSKPDSDSARSERAKEASFQFESGTWQSLPTLHHIARVLAEMPFYGTIEAKRVTVSGVADLSDAHRLD